MAIIVATYVFEDLDYVPMASNQKITPVDKSRIFEVEEYLFSVTDRLGVIKACNDVVCRVSGYEPQELLGSPYSVVNHPDMPRAVYTRVRSYLEKGRPVGAYLKNLAKSGEYYWVYAVAVPIDDGYLSIRMKPSTDLLPELQNLYARVREVEHSFSDDRQEGLRQAGELLDAGLRDAGFESYEDFMVQALNRELDCHQAKNDDQARATSLFRQTGEVKRLFELRESLTSISDFFDGLSVKIRRVAINASIVAARLEEKGDALGVISEEVSTVAERLTEETTQVREQVEDLRHQLFATSFNASLGRLLREVSGDFEKDKGEASASADQQRLAYGSTISEICAMLDARCTEAEKSHARSSIELQRSLKRFNRFIDALSRILMTLQFGYVTGKSVSVAIDGGQEFSILLEDLAGYYSEAQAELKNTRDKVRGVPSKSQATRAPQPVKPALVANSSGSETLSHSAA